MNFRLKLMNFVVHGFLETVGIELQLEAATAGECILRKIYQSRGMYIGLTAAAPATAAMAHLGAVGGMLAVSTMLAELAMFFSSNNDDFCIRNDGFCIQDDEFCIQNEGEYDVGGACGVSAREACVCEHCLGESDGVLQIAT